MKYCVLILFLFTGIWSKAANGDTTTVKAFDKFHMGRYGNFDTRVKMPDQSKSYQRIWMKLTLGCTSNGQCEWDYTLKAAVRERTGMKDSTLKQAPSYKANGNSPDSLRYSSDTTWVNSFNSTTKKTDSVPATKYTIIRFLNTASPLTPTDTLIGWAANYYRYNYDSTGRKTDSVFISSNQTIYKVNTPYYDVFEIINNYEIARLITPYAKFFNKNFQYEYLFDVTDYTSLLHDSTDIRLIYEGYTFGFTSTVEFYFIEGTPAREAYKVVNVYNGYFPYGNANNPIENYLKLKAYKVDSGAAETKLRIMVTGHGGEQNENCAEFCAKNYYLKINGTQLAKQLIWRDNCGSNAIINQGGTWIYNRANWCPGELVTPYEYELNVSKNDSLKIDIDMDPFTANGSAGYGYEAQLVYYKANTRNVDAGIERIMAPTKDQWFSKSNPVCDNAKVMVRNFGKSTITQILFKFQVGNAPVKFHYHNTNLKPYQAEEAVLPWMVWSGDISDKTFKVWIETVNNQADENTTNNTMSSVIDLPPTLPLNFIVETRTNNRPQDNNYTIKDNQGITKFTKTFTQANTIHKDTITLGYGCYTFLFNDVGGNGLSFWNPPVEGSGYVRFTTNSQFITLLKTFNADFGSFVQFNFRVGSPVGAEEVFKTNPQIKIYPQPATDYLKIESSDIIPVKIQLTDINGRMIRIFNDMEVNTGLLNVSSLQKGIYFLTITGNNNQTVTKKVIVGN